VLDAKFIAPAPVSQPVRVLYTGAFWKLTLLGVGMRWLLVATICFAWVVPAEADCRSEAMAAIQRGATSGSYRYESQIKLSGGQSFRISGIFVAPDKAHLIYPDGQELIWDEGPQWMWMKTPDGEWHALVVPPHVDHPIELGAPDPDRISSARCLGEVIEDGRTYVAYEFEIFLYKQDQSPKAPISTWKVLSDRTTALPVRYFRRTHLSSTDVIEDVETRVYEPGLKVELPVKAPPATPVEPKR
jgi:hypothetical protein